MTIPASRRDTVLYVVACIFLAYYLSAIPIFLTGNWLNNLNPVRIISANPLLLLALPWALIPHRNFVVAYFCVVCLIMLVFNQMSGGWVAVNVISKSGFGVFVLLWLETFLPAFVAPAILSYLLLNCDKFGPKIIRGWSESETKTV